MEKKCMPECNSTHDDPRIEEIMNQTISRARHSEGGKMQQAFYLLKNLRAFLDAF
jgi:hypothetical protein